MVPRSLQTAFAFVLVFTSCVGAADGPVAWRTDFDRALGEAQATGKLLLVNIHATWCIPCKKLNATTLADPGLAAEITQACIPVSLDADQDAHVIQQWPITGFPTQLFLTPDGKVINTIVGFVPVATYQATLRKSLEAMGGVASARTAAPQPKTPLATSVASPSTPTPNAMAQIDSPPPVRNAGLARSLPPGLNSPAPPVGMQASMGRSPSITGVAPLPPAPATNPANPAAPAVDPQAFAGSMAPPPAAPAPAWDNVPPNPAPVRSTVVGGSGIGEIRPCDASLPLALEGFCPVSMFKRSELIRGADDQCCVYKDKRYQFVSAEEREAFQQDPKRFLPSEDGLCVVTWAEAHQRSTGSINYPALFGDYLFLFANDDARQRFLQDPERYVDAKGRAHRIPLHSFRGDRSTVR